MGWRLGGQLLVLGTAAAVAGIGGGVDCWCWKDSRVGVVSVEGGRSQQAGQQLQVRPERVVCGGDWFWVRVPDGKR